MKKFTLTNPVPFKELSKIKFENITNGRQGAVIAKIDNNLIPIVRTTSVYTQPIQEFNDIHHSIANQIKNCSFNNALVEIYNDNYKTMGYHSDQALDLEDDSFIAIYSCYENSSNPKRKLLIKNKETKECSEITMEHNSIILFDLLTNSQNLHKIVLEGKSNSDPSNRWIGVTFRLSKTYINSENLRINNSNRILQIATERQRQEFYKHRGLENKKTNYIYPEINYTLSPSDIMPSISKENSINYNDLLKENNIHNVGIYFDNFFDPEKDYFNLISTEHEFQSLTESTKAGSSYRTGIYLTKVEKESEEIQFNLLRCSTNLTGPTDNFRQTDTEIIKQVNQLTDKFFNQKVDMNHVLAQIYTNVKVTNNKNVTKEKKARIKKHSDKTKDMPRNALIAFCTFYQKHKDYDTIHDIPDTALTKLRFKLKKLDHLINNPDLSDNFDIILKPNSIFIISLSTNRLYTHEISPPIVPIDKMPTRLGYVIRCSDTKAVFKDNNTYIGEPGDGYLSKLVPIQESDTKELKNIYYEENMTDNMIYYPPTLFSMNTGDYTKPIV
jgi:hypothetical protein